MCVVACTSVLGHKEDALDPIKISDEPCPRCGGKLVFKDTVESPRTGSLVRFFRCEGCGHVHTVERQSVNNALSSDPLAAPEAAAKRKRA